MSGHGHSSSGGGLNLTLKVWRQKDAASAGGLASYQVSGISTDMSFLEMLDILNEQLLEKGEEPIAFDHDCREGICGMCSLVINGNPHGPDSATTTCQLHMRRFKDGDVITIEPWRAKPFPVIRDLVVDRSAFDRIQARGGFVSVNTGGTPDANAIPIPKREADLSMDAAQCIGCGACVAACKNASAMLFVGAKVSQYLHLPQGQPERYRRVLAMMEQHDAEGFGGCTNFQECEAACPKEISVRVIAEMNRDFLRATLVGTEL
ncbi:MAG: succinate dehydrogenase/fumarate reductase iron-sulfur subunit [Deltaproteobacteria bacterium]|nr:succinate dehydrogenase/fumarate reductase iron-sulfur subunit [Deltaproteobacteria bacterium]